MQRFCVTAVSQEGKKYFVANWPGDREPWSRRAPKRRQKKFTTLEKAEAFLEEARREYTRNGGVTLAEDRELHYDFMRAVEVIAGIPGASLEKGAYMLKMCRSACEKRGGSFEAPRSRVVELGPREFLLCQNEARRCGIPLNEMTNRILMMWLEREATARVKERKETEAREELELRRRAAREYQRANYKPKAIREREAIARMMAEIEEQHAGRVAERGDGD